MRWAVVLLLFGATAHAEELLTLATAVDRARAHHPTVDVQRAEVGIAAARIEQAVAGLTPALTGGFGYAPQTANYAVTPAIARELATTSGADTVVDQGGVATVVSCRTPGQGNCAPVGAPPTSWSLYSYWQLNIGLTWTVWDWGRSIYGVKSAQSSRQSAELGVKSAERDAMLNVKLAYFGAVAATEQLRVGEETVTSYRAHLEQIEAFHKSGLRTGIDVATAQAALANAQIQLARTRASLRSAQIQLVAAMGDESWQDWKLQPASALFTLDGKEDDPNRSESELVDTGLQRRPEVRALDLQAMSYAQQQKSARGQYLPQLMLNAGPTWAGPGLGSLVPNFDAIVSLSYPITGMNPFYVHGQARQAAAQHAQTVSQLRLERLAIRQEVVTARALWVSAIEEVRAAEILVSAAGQQRSLAEGRYQAGVGNVIELYDALLADANARFQSVQAGYDLASSKARVAHSIGQDR